MTPQGEPKHVAGAKVEDLTTRASVRLGRKDYEALEDEFVARASLEDLRAKTGGSMRR